MASEEPAADRSRSPRRRVLTFGRHSGRTFEDVFRTEPGYCDWALRVPRPSGYLREFARWVSQERGLDSHASESESDSDLFGPPVRLQNFQAISRIMSDMLEARLEDAEDDQGDDDEGGSDDENGGSPARRLAAQRATCIIEHFPQVEYTAKLFSGEPHPDCCPICMEDFAPCDDVPSKRILLTPCFHAYHEHCLKGWVEKKHLCPTCRWDLRDTGQSAVRSHGPRPTVVVPPELVGTTLEISDDDS